MRTYSQSRACVFNLYIENILFYRTIQHRDTDSMILGNSYAKK